MIWIVLDRGEASVCVHHPGSEPDVFVTATTPTLAEIFQGFDTWPRALATGAVCIEGPPALRRALPRWFTGSPFRDVTEARATRPT